MIMVLIMSQTISIMRVLSALSASCERTHHTPSAVVGKGRVIATVSVCGHMKWSYSVLGRC